MTKEQTTQLMVAILSLSLLTVMAGAAVAPALDVIREHFSSSPVALVRLVISLPALFIALSSPAFPALAKRFSVRALVLGALALYVVAGVGAGVVDNIYVLLALRALVGVSVGIIMPLSTGLLAYYFPPERQSALMGYSSAMNQMGGVVATLLAGVLATISWRTAFLVYAMGLVCMVLCAVFVPNAHLYAAEERVSGAGEKGGSTIREDAVAAAPAVVTEASREAGAGEGQSVLRRYGILAASMFFLMVTFFVYPSSYALISAEEGVLSPLAVTGIMTWLDFVAFVGGLAFAGLHRRLKSAQRFAAPVLFFIGYALLASVGGWVGGIVGSALIGFANGIGVPHLMSTGSLMAGKRAATTVLPLLSTALYLGQFATPFVLAAVEASVGSAFVPVPYLVALASAIVYGICSAFIREPR